MAVNERDPFLSRLNFITHAKMGGNASVLSEILLKLFVYWDVLHNLTMTGKKTNEWDTLRCIAL